MHKPEIVWIQGLTSGTETISTGTDSYNQVLVGGAYGTVVCGAHVTDGKVTLRQIK
jgi:hypothetical protein